MLPSESSKHFQTSLCCGTVLMAAHVAYGSAPTVERQHVAAKAACINGGSPAPSCGFAARGFRSARYLPAAF